MGVEVNAPRWFRVSTNRTAKALGDFAFHRCTLNCVEGILTFTHPPWVPVPIVARNTAQFIGVLGVSHVSPPVLGRMFERTNMDGTLFVAPF